MQTSGCKDPKLQQASVVLIVMKFEGSGSPASGGMLWLRRFLIWTCDSNSFGLFVDRYGPSDFEGGIELIKLIEGGLQKGLQAPFENSAPQNSQIQF